MAYQFTTGDELLLLCARHDASIGEIMLRREMEREQAERGALLREMRLNLAVMRQSVKKGLSERQPSVTGMSGGDAERLFAYAGTGSFLGENACRAVAGAIAVVEVNAAMGKLVAAPTAGASGVLPGTLLQCGKQRGWDDDTLIMGLFAGAAVGMLIARNAGISGAGGGCQAETGAAASMAAAALAQCAGGTPLVCLHAAAMAVKNVLGLVCDPVAGLVECPCIKRNAMGAANALLCADMALCGIQSYIPFDEVVWAMHQVGRTMHADLRETARGGLAATPTGRALQKRLQLDLE